MMTAEPTSLQIVARRPARAGAELDLRCPSCHAVFTVFQPTIVGLALGQHSCPGCGARGRLVPGESDVTAQSEDDRELAREARRIAETWHQHGQFPASLEYRGVNLGAAASGVLEEIVRAGLTPLETRS